MRCVDAYRRALRISQSDSPYAEEHALLAMWLKEHDDLEKEIAYLDSLADRLAATLGCPACRSPDCPIVDVPFWREQARMKTSGKNQGIKYEDSRNRSESEA